MVRVSELVIKISQCAFRRAPQSSLPLSLAQDLEPSPSIVNCARRIVMDAADRGRDAGVSF